MFRKTPAFANHLIYRLIIFDACALAALIWGSMAGLVWPLFQQDTSFISVAIVAVFLLGKASLFGRCAKVSAAKNSQKAGEKLRLKPDSFLAKSEHLSDMVEAVAILGLVGTLIGLAMVIQSLDPAVDYATAIDHIKDGGSIAVNTSIVGAVAGLWLNVGRRMLNTATVTAISDEGA
jgi:membrane associated rhomboid family serine protease